MTDQNLDDFDVFSDTPEQATEEVAEPVEEVKQSDAENSKETPSEETGEKEEAEATPAEQEDDQAEKMIPEHRFKAALKDVTDKLDAANAELEKMSRTPAPDRETDPDGYDLHMRVETSRAIMQEAYPDYGEVMQHYIEIEKANPMISQVVAAHPAPAKHAYDLAKKDLEIRELSSLKNSKDWEEFQAFKKMQAEQAKAANPKPEDTAKQKKESVPEVPNLNRATDVSSKTTVQQLEDDGLFEGAL